MIPKPGDIIKFAGETFHPHGGFELMSGFRRGLVIEILESWSGGPERSFGPVATVLCDECLLIVPLAEEATCFEICEP